VTTVSVLGSGVMATALTIPLAENGHEVRLVGTHLDRDIIESIKETGVHPGLEREIPETVRPYQIEEVEAAFEGARVVLSGVNSFGVRWAAERLAALLEPGMMVISVTKGMEAAGDGSLRILPDVLAEAASPDLRDRVSWSAIAGPSIAGEVAARRDTCVVFTGREEGALSRLATIFRTSYYHVWTSTDFVGVEACAAMKNCYALGVGFAEGILERSGEAESRDRNHDYEAALFGEAAIEIGQMVRLLGGRPETAHGLAGVGDMYVTSTGGRNVRVGRLLGSGLRFSEAREKMAGITLEGAAAIKVIGGALLERTERGELKSTDFPLMRHLYAVVVEDRPVQVPWETFFGGEG
jgi:glycerol-3-phosphate dehydrogenase (NAD(P)+)